MSLTIGPYTFPVVHYDEEGDVLYLHMTAPDGALDFVDTPDGHGLRYDAEGRLVGMTLLNVKWLTEHGGKITVTVPQHVEVDSGLLDQALTATETARA